MGTYLGSEWQGEGETEDARTECDGSLPGFEATGSEGDDAADDALPNDQLPVPSPTSAQRNQLVVSNACPVLPV